MNPLATKAMLVRLSVHSWYGKKIDRKAAAAAAASLQIDGSTDEYYKHLVPKQAFRELSDIIVRLRAYHHWATFPWFDNGLRVLPGKIFFEYRGRIDTYKNEFSEAVGRFVADYETYKTFAANNRASIYDPKDYPDVEDLRAMFRIEMNVMPIPENDFRVDLDPQTLDELKRQLVSDQQDVLQRNLTELLTNLQTRILALKAMCIKDPPKIYDATVARVIDCAEMAQNLNLTNDGRLTAVASTALSHLNVDPNILRADPEARKRVVSACNDILELYL